MKNTLNRPLLKTALLSAFALTCVTAVAQNGPTLVFTELPGDVLTVTGPGGAAFGSVKLVSGGAIQKWLWAPPANVSFQPVAANLPVWWIEPDSLPGEPTTYNEISVANLPSGVLGLEIQSDIGGATGNNIFKDGTIVPDLFVVSTPAGTAEVGAQFIDKGDSVPDTASTLSLLGGALTLVGAVGRKLGK